MLESVVKTADMNLVLAFIISWQGNVFNNIFMLERIICMTKTINMIKAGKCSELESFITETNYCYYVQDFTFFLMKETIN